ncbi:MAG: hypothetical protein OEY06_11565 [Gammaproteobacteria bacterium]|nr:hypothetical protein [Gammaproteobacteria bacterium]
MEITANLIRGKYGLAKTFWLLWFFPSILFGILLDPEIYFPFIISLNQKSYYLAMSFSFFIPVLFYLFNIVMAVANWNAANHYEGFKAWPLLTKVYIVISLLALSYGTYIAFA